MKRIGSRPAGLAWRTGWVMVVVVVIAVGVAGVVSINLVRSSARTEARKSLSSQADVVASLLAAGRPGNLGRALRTVRNQDTPVAWQQQGAKLHGDPLAKKAYLKRNNPLADGVAQSFIVQLDNRDVLVEVRPLGADGVMILAKKASLATGPALKVLQRELIALAIGLALALLAAALFARWLAGPLRRTAAAATLLASGDRDVRLQPEGPHEVAEVSGALNSLADALRHSERRQREFLLSVSHELRTPLTAIRGFGESLADGVTTGEDVEQAGRVIVSESARLERLVADLLDLARLGSDDFRFDIVPVDLAALTGEAAGVWQSRCAAAGVDFRLEQPGGPLPLHSDPGRLRQIIDGLAENALRVTPAGQPLVLALRPEGDHAVIEVRDGGPGLTEDDMAVAFERSALYERYRGVRKVGTGLGLALVKTLATGLGGTVSVSSAPEGGSCFRVLLPVRPPVGP